jgi:SAGA-associated factor 73
MGAKRSVLGRSKKYDELLLEWQRANNPNFVEPVKRETKAEKKEKREKERLEKKRLAEEAAAAMGLDPIAIKKAGAASIAKKSSKKSAAANAALRLADQLRDDNSEDLDDLDSEVEIEELIGSVKLAREHGAIGVPLAVPCDASSWFVQRRERARCCRDLLLNALSSGGGTGTSGGIGTMSMVSRSTSLSSGTASMRPP